jgi:hypothetical protein
VIASSSTWRIERQREHREVRRAKRLVAAEIHTVWTHLALLALAKESPRYLADPRERFLPAALWHDYRSALAGAAESNVGDEQWRSLALLYDTVDGIRRLVLDHAPGTRLDSDVIEGARDAAKRARDAHVWLTGVPPDEA